MIEVQNLSFSYTKGNPVLQEISLKFSKQSTAIIGENGAGKTTFVKLVKGLLKPLSGEIRIGQEDIKHLSTASLSSKIGLVFQNPNDQIFKGKVLDEVMFGPLNIDQDETIALKNATKALEWVGLADYQEANPQDLSLSQKKLLCIASILAMDTKVVILDEPTIGQDYTGKKQISMIIRRLQAEGKLVITIIHDMDFVAENFERTIVFEQGRVLLDDETRNVFSRKDVLRAAHVDTPYITQLGEAIGLKKTVLTINEFTEEYAKIK